MLFYACKKKELPPEDQGETALPVFYLKGMVNGLPLKLEAGANDYYMNSSYFLDTSNVYVYKAELKQKNCNGVCGYGITVLINDFQAAQQGMPMNVDGGLKTGTYNFNDQNFSPPYYSAKFTPVEAKVSTAAYSWVFSDGQVINGYEATRNFDAHKKYTATLNYSKDCSASHLNLFDVGNNLQTTVQATRDMNLIETLTYHFSSNATGSGPYRYHWDFGDDTEISTESNPTHRYLREGRYTAKLQMTDDNNFCTSYYQVSASFQKDCSANYTAVFTPVKNTKAFSAITVIVTDPNGVIYSSRETNQPDNSSFEIVSIDDYKENERSELTKKIKIKFNCSTKANGNEIVIKNGEAVIAVSYK